MEIPTYYSYYTEYIYIPLLIALVFEVLVLLLLREYHIKVLVACLVTNLLTNPTLYYYWIIGEPTKYSFMNIMLGLLFVFALETVCYRLVIRNWCKAAIYSALCNAVSFSLSMFTLFIYQLATEPRCRL